MRFIPVLKSNKSTPKDKDAKPNKTAQEKGGVPDFAAKQKYDTADPGYRPFVQGKTLPEPPKEGDVIEFRHPEHGRKVRGRVTAVGEDGVTARRAAEDGPLNVHHGNITAVLPSQDYGQEPGMSPQDAQDQFLGPTKEGGMPATSLQIALLDVMAQYGFPIDEDTLSQIDYDQARRLLTQYVLEDDGRTDPPMDEGDDDEEDGGDDEDPDGQADVPDEDDRETPEDEGEADADEQGADAEEDDPDVQQALENLIEALEVSSAKNGDGPDADNDDEERGDDEDDKPAPKRVKNEVKRGNKPPARR